MCKDVNEIFTLPVKCATSCVRKDSLRSPRPFSYSCGMFATVDAVFVFHNTAAALAHPCPTANCVRRVGAVCSTARLQTTLLSKDRLVVTNKIWVKK